VDTKDVIRFLLTQEQAKLARALQSLQSDVETLVSAQGAQSYISSVENTLADIRRSRERINAFEETLGIR
jgi:vacuolar-type H+-ATPase subunit D/Vma8